ncbi:TIGR04282 family arsenosugar biosynthesis glycosyltransferase [Salinisphaera sp. LB1]|uniref:TIGR04282 family arsenosugar biosynthesis glycosyltransferase n=1 Tax=Salinisphaera sp. LB1 TaxID=2183911 RepID=UPI000D7087D5|nr:TIGR04282 family arsenosugar biosynthesis glycosyltransferase [Salinisphaera sp. LB1]AWN14446.1 Glycosyltransferase [Salinisphaera sp. LB1]
MKPAPDLHIAVFAKPLIPGQVKTRLIPSVGAETAAELQRAMLWKTLAVARDAAGEQVSLWVAGDPEHPTLVPFRDAFAPTMHAQRGDDLGARMRSAMSTLLTAHDRVLLVGCDCPVLSADDLRDAATALGEDRTDTVFIPVEDGGYVLVGLKARSGPELQKAVLDAVFGDIPWSTDQVMTQTRARLAAAGLCWVEQPALWDMDRPEDLRRAEAMDVLDRRIRGHE